MNDGDGVVAVATSTAAAAATATARWHTPKWENMEYFERCFSVNTNDVACHENFEEFWPTEVFLKVTLP